MKKRILPLSVGLVVGLLSWSAQGAAITSGALEFSEDTFVFSPTSAWQSELLGDVTVELFGIDPESSSFRLRASGSIMNSLTENDYGLAYKFITSVNFHLYPRGSEFVVMDSAVVDFTIPTGPGVFSGEDCIHDPTCPWVPIPHGVGTNGLSAEFPDVLDPFDWSATFEITVSELVGDYGLYGNFGVFDVVFFSQGGWDSGGDGWALDPEDAGFSIQSSPIPEPSAVVSFCVGGLIVGGAVRVRRKFRTDA